MTNTRGSFGNQSLALTCPRRQHSLIRNVGELEFLNFSCLHSKFLKGGGVIHYTWFFV